VYIRAINAIGLLQTAEAYYVEEFIVTARRLKPFAGGHAIDEAEAERRLKSSLVKDHPKSH
jgi:hypothetical protein